MKISGLVSVRGVMADPDGIIDIDFKDNFMGIGDRDKLTGGVLYWYNLNDKLYKQLRLGTVLKITMEVFDGTNDTGEN